MESAVRISEATLEYDEQASSREAPAPLSGLRRNQELRAARNFMGRLGPYMEQHPRGSVTERFRGAMADLKGKK